jgi:DNA gyrase subunit A
MRFPVSEFDNLKDKIKNELGRDCVRYLFRSVNSHFVLLFGASGSAYVLRTSFIPLSSSLESFTPVTRLLQLDREESFVDCYEVDKFIENRYIFLSTRDGLVKRIRLTDFAKVKPGGSVVIGLRDDDKLVSAKQTGGNQEVVLATAEGRCIRFSEDEVREMGLSAGGIRGMDLEKKDVVVSVVALQPGKSKTTIATLTSMGFGKRSELDEYSTTHRGGKGIVNYKTSPKVGRVTGVLEVKDSDLIVWLSKKGKQKRLKAKEIKTMGRATQGAALAALKQGDEIVDVFILTTDAETKL